MTGREPSHARDDASEDADSVDSLLLEAVTVPIGNGEHIAVKI